MQLQTNLQRKHCLLLLFPHKEMVNVDTLNSNGARPEVLKSLNEESEQRSKMKNAYGGLQIPYSKRMLNGFALQFCHCSASDLFPIFPHSTSNQRVFSDQCAIEERMLFTFCETYYHPSDCSKLIVCHKCLWVKFGVPLGRMCWRVISQLCWSWSCLKECCIYQGKINILIRITQKILFGHRCANGFWELG